MKIKDYIANQVLLPRLEEFEVLVVYDAERRYRQLCQELATDMITVVDATEGSIPARELACKTLQDLGKRTGAKKRLLIYVPVRPPQTSPDKIQDPFSMYGEIGDYFPRTAGDSFEQICLKARAEQATEIRKVFAEHPTPSFDLIDNVGGGAGWPALQSVLGVQSAREILVHLLKPSSKQLEKLTSDSNWISEFKELLRRNIGVELKTQIQEFSAVQAELWRLMLFSEFIFDLPNSTAVPPSLASVPKAIPEAMPLVYAVCEALRDQSSTQGAYIEMATKVETDLNLRATCTSIPDLGVRDTFPFEERSFFAHCLAAIDKDDVDTCRSILARNQKSVWTGLGESQVQWSLIASIVGLIEACADAERELVKYTASQEKLVFYYLDQFFKVDLRYREFETAVFSTIDIDPQLQPAIQRARKTYSSSAAQVQKIFIKHLETSGWPPSNMLSSTEIFDKLVAPTLAESGRKVAYFLIDALRYELGTELERELNDEGDISLVAAFSVIPTVTPIGMASLMPNAQASLKVAKKDDAVVPMLGDKEIKSVTQRMDWIRSKYGQRFHEMKLTEVIKPDFNKKLNKSVELLVIRSSTTDGRMETDYEFGLPSITRDLQLIRVAVRRLREAGFELAVIATDHGFCINPETDAGDVCSKPSGTWKNLHDRCLLGDGTADTHNWVLSAEHMGLRGDYAQVGGPRGLACYSAGNKYFHGGASLQESLVPVLSVKLSQKVAEADAVQFRVSYKRNSPRITTKLPVFEIETIQQDLFSSDQSYDLLVRAVAPDGKVVGEPKPGGPVNAATGTVSVDAGTTIKLTVQMSMSYEGKFEVQLLDPNTLTVHSQIELETDYLV